MRDYVKVVCKALGLLLLLVPLEAAIAQTDSIPDDLKPIAAAMRIFALENGLHGDLTVAGIDEGYITHNFYRGKYEDYEVHHAPNQKCVFTIRRKGGPIIEAISFDRLSSEYRTFRDPDYVRLVVKGQPGSVCNFLTNKCQNGLTMLLMDNGMEPHELEQALRALGYIFSNVCKPAELPF